MIKLIHLSKVYDDVAAITEGKQNFKNTVLSIAEADAKLAPLEYCHTNFIKNYEKIN